MIGCWRSGMARSIAVVVMILLNAAGCDTATVENSLTPATAGQSLEATPVETTRVREVSEHSKPLMTPCWSSVGTVGIGEEHLLRDTDWWDYLNPPHANSVQWSPDGTMLFFTFLGEVYAVAADGNRLRHIERPHRDGLVGHWTAFQLAPDGSDLVYASCEYPRSGVGPKPPPWEYQHDLVMRSLHDGARQRLTASNDFESYPAWSPDGTYIAYLSGSLGYRRNDLYVMEADGANARMLSGPDFVVNQVPAWSPDGRWLAVTGVDKPGGGATLKDISDLQSLYIIPMPSGSGVRRLSDAVSGAAWSPNGQRLAFAKVDGDGVALFTIAVDGTDVQRVTTIVGWRTVTGGRPAWLVRDDAPDPGIAWIDTVAWSPDGSKILYSCATMVCVAGVDGTLVSEAPLNGLVAAWSPDGSRVATLRPEFLDREHTPVVQLVAPDGANARTLVMQDAERQLRAADPRQPDTLVDDAGCATGAAVAEPSANTDLVGDCKVLLALRDTLAGSAALNWTGGRPMAEWEGVVVAGTPPRVRELRLVERGLTGVLPRELGQLTQLRKLDLRRNALGRDIPPEIGKAAALRTLVLSSNFLSGAIPPELGQLASLEVLTLDDNQLSGAIPPDLARLTKLRRLSVGGNQLTGCIPPGVPILHPGRLDLPVCE